MNEPAAASPRSNDALIVLHAQSLASLESSRKLGRLVPAWIISAIVHLVLLAFFLLIPYRTEGETTETEGAVFETEVGEKEAPPNLENDEIGLDPSVQTNYNVDRIEEISVPGPVRADQDVGIDNASAMVPASLPPPPGVGGNGTGGGADDPSRFGVGNVIGLAGGMGGLKMLPGGLGGRSGATRQKMLVEGGGNAASEAAVARGLKWLAEHQAPDGHWAIDTFARDGKCNCKEPGTGKNDIAGTAFGLLPFLGAGQTHKTGADKGNLYAKQVERGLRFMVLNQNREGSFNNINVDSGNGGQGSVPVTMYTHGLATIALCEAYGLSSDPALRRPAQRALDFIVAAQNPTGGWDYGPRGGTNDGSIGGWQLMALKSGQMAGLDSPTRSLNAAKVWLDAFAIEPQGYGYSYRAPKDVQGGSTYQTMSAIGMLCRMYLGWGPRHPGLVRGAEWLLQPGQIPPTSPSNIYFHYYATQVMHHVGGTAWDRWNVRMRDHLINTQDQGQQTPHQKGSWTVNDDIWGRYGGRVMQTSMSLLTLEVYYRHLPLYRREVGADKALQE